MHLPPHVEAMHPTVQTLVGPAFEAACASLMNLASASYAPTLLVGIRTGGLFVAESMARSHPTALPVLSLTCRRAGTKTKSRIPGLNQMLVSLPQGMVDKLRLLEHRVLSARRARLAVVPEVDQQEAKTIAEAVAAAPGARILVVDDAVDSGLTLNAVLELLRGNTPAGTELRSAVITVTLDAPRVEPDYALYRGVLCRFPWSFDAAR
jgi:hypoxanthine phosphoribosyltransferase